MRPTWTMRQLLALLRGLALMLSVLIVLIAFQLLPSLLRGGIIGVRRRIEQVAIAGVPPEQWSTAISKMYVALAGVTLLAILLYLAQRYLARKILRT